MTKSEKIIEIQRKLNLELGEILRQNGITKLNLTSVGNSIASGYSMVRTLMPMLLRNTTIQTDMSKNRVEVSIRHFARAQDNNDEHIFEWLIENIKQSEIHKMNRADYGSGDSSMPSPGIKNEDLDK